MIKKIIAIILYTFAALLALAGLLTFFTNNLNGFGLLNSLFWAFLIGFFGSLIWPTENDDEF
ncbi:MAG: hypothetical protein QNL04_00065 [SAR324 cluster bacterium]|nr:hypothetical protein [SAR324 cluster bacterium]